MFGRDDWRAAVSFLRTGMYPGSITIEGALQRIAPRGGPAGTIFAPRKVPLVLQIVPLRLPKIRTSPATAETSLALVANFFTAVRPRSS